MSFPHHILTDNSEQDVSTRYLRYLVQWSSIAFLWYDYTLTFKSEVKYIWRQKFRVSTVLYALCRYPLITNVIELFIIGDKFGSSCNALYKTIYAMSLLGRSAVIVVFTVRTYAICNNNRYIFVYLAGIGITWMGVSIWHVVYLDCAPVVEKDMTGPLTSIFMCIFEFSAAFITFFRCAKSLRGAKGEVIRMHHFLLLILEQGILYFIFTALFTIAAFILHYYVTPEELSQTLLGMISLPLSCLLTARFLLHLRRLKDKLEYSTGGTSYSTVSEGQGTVGLESLRFNANVTQLSSFMMDLSVGASLDDQTTLHDPEVFSDSSDK